ncbi:malto-oligosyltrehalose trehalohydrolase [Roseivirga sp. BDSF3-8]|uniref:malto-oligosyltrehalose trehalohydrolase n=1 Tax=Roseivirga sp. BDSF3-8 TaxID=3241598 RepID=UPI00353229F9
MNHSKIIPGAVNNGKKETTFTVWAPDAKAMQLVLESSSTEQAMEKRERGYWQLKTEAPAGTLYRFRQEGKGPLPDPASLYQPDGVHGPSEVIDRNAFEWTDGQWHGMALEQMVIYELHVGTFTDEGTFRAMTGKLDYLKRLGVNTIEIMPVAQFPGNRNWGYDGVFPYATQNSYGGPGSLKMLIDACHAQGMAVVLDVVYNHLGPEGNYLHAYGPYFTDKYQTPWGMAVNYDDAWCDQVRHYFLKNALMWLDEFHIDGLRLDAVHAIKDLSPKHFLKELAEEVRTLETKTGCRKVLIAECDLNDRRFITEGEHALGLDSQWIDEFHHAVRAYVTGEKRGYYSEFGTLNQVAKAFNDTYVYDGIWSPGRKKTFGTSAKNIDYQKFITFIQNHDQVGNRMLGDRLSTTVSYEMQKVMAATLLLSPYVPMLFMGEEYGEKNPFQYFTSHGDEQLIKAVREGRKREFADFQDEGEAPDPHSEETYNRSKLSWRHDQATAAKALWEYYRFLIQLRQTHAALMNRMRGHLEAKADNEKDILFVRRFSSEEGKFAIIVCHFGKTDKETSWPEAYGQCRKVLDSAAAQWQGPGEMAPANIAPGDTLSLPAESVCLYESI